MNYTKTVREIHGQKIEAYKVENDINGNPRYVVHFLNIAKTFADAKKIANDRVGGREYRAKWYGGGIVFTSYNLDDTLKTIIAFNL